MAISAEISTLWQQHSSAVFPKGYRDREINGIDLPLLDAEIAGCVHLYLNNSGKIDSQRVKTLRKNLIDLNNILLLLNSEELTYFDRLRRLADLVLQEVDR